MLGKSDRNILRGGAPWFAPGLALDYVAKHAIDFWITTEDLPHPANRVTVDRRGRIHLAKTYHNLEPHKRLLAKLKELMGPLGCHDAAIPAWSILDQRIPLAGVAHQSGTVRFGDERGLRLLRPHGALPRPGRAPAVRRQLARHRLARVRPGRQANPSQGARPDQDRGAGQGSGICTPTSRRASAKPQAMIVQQAAGDWPLR
jgi:hypothetical protein